LALEAEEAARLTDYKDGNKALEAEEAARLTDSKDSNLVSKDGNKAHGCQVAQCCQVSGTWLPGTGLPVHGGQGALDCTGSGARAIMKKVHPSKQHKQQPQQQQTADASRGSCCILSNMIAGELVHPQQHDRRRPLRHSSRTSTTTSRAPFLRLLRPSYHYSDFSNSVFVHSIRHYCFRMGCGGASHLGRLGPLRAFRTFPRNASPFLLPLSLLILLASNHVTLTME